MGVTLFLGLPVSGIFIRLNSPTLAIFLMTFTFSMDSSAAGTSHEMPRYVAARSPRNGREKPSLPANSSSKRSPIRLGARKGARSPTSLTVICRERERGNQRKIISVPSLHDLSFSSKWTHSRWEMVRASPSYNKMEGVQLVAGFFIYLSSLIGLCGVVMIRNAVIFRANNASKCAQQCLGASDCCTVWSGHLCWRGSPTSGGTQCHKRFPVTGLLMAVLGVLGGITAMYFLCKKDTVQDALVQNVGGGVVGESSGFTSET